MELLDYVEAAAKDNAAFHLGNADVLARESNTLLNILLAGAGGSLAYLLTLLDKGADLWMKAGVASIAAYLFLVAAVLLWKCLYIRPFFPATNEPKNRSRDFCGHEQLAEPVRGDEPDCATARAKGSACGPEGALFVSRLLVSYNTRF